MSKTFLAGWVVGLVFIALAVGTISLWLSARLSRVRPLSIGKALSWVLLMGLFSLPNLIFLFCDQAFDRGPWLQGGLGVASLIGVGWCLRGALHATWGRTALAAAMFLAFSLSLAGALAVKFLGVVMASYRASTGSAALAVIGMHLDVACPSCGIRFPVGVPSGRNRDGGAMADIPPRRISCFNCRAFIEVPGNARLMQGDRFMLDKLSPPRRWDLVAYKVEQEVLYLHRLVGLGGETIEIVDGDLFADGKRLVRPPPRTEEMWIPVHDSGPSRGEGPPRSWKPSGPVEAQPKTGDWILSGPEAGFDLEGPIDDSFAYNAYAFETRTPPAFVPVHDVRVDLGITSLGRAGEPAGRLVLEWKHVERAVQAAIEGSGRVRIESSGRSASGDLGASPAGKTIAFQVRDGVAAVFVGGKEIASLEIGPSGIDDARKIPTGIPCRVSIRIPAGTAGINRILLFRDVHYRKDLGNTAWPVRLGPEQCFILGDNCLMSFDSRYSGPSHKETITGVARWLFAPLSRSRFFE